MIKLLITRTLSKSLDSPAICSADTWKPSNSVYWFWKFEHDFFPFCCKLEQFMNASIKAFTLTDFSIWMRYSANNIFPYFSDPINFDKSFFRCHFCEQWFFFLSLLTCVQNHRGSLYKAQPSWVYLVSFSRSFQMMSLYFPTSEARIPILSSFSGLYLNKTQEV